jgi:GH18 family chitinase
MSKAQEMISLLNESWVVTEDDNRSLSLTHAKGIYEKLDSVERANFDQYVNFLNTQRYNFKGSVPEILEQMEDWQLTQVVARYKGYMS